MYTMNSLGARTFGSQTNMRLKNIMGNIILSHQWWLFKGYIDKSYIKIYYKSIKSEIRV